MLPSNIYLTDGSSKQPTNATYQTHSSLQLFTVLTAIIENDQDIEVNIKHILEQYVRTHHGSIIFYHKDSFTCLFRSLSKAVQSCHQIMAMLNNYSINITTGIFLKEASITNPAEVIKASEKFLQKADKTNHVNKILVNSSIPPHLINQSVQPHKGAKITPSVISVDHLQKPQESPKIRKTFIDHVFSFIDKYLNHEQLNVEMISREMCMSERQLQRKIKELTNKSPNQLIQEARLNQAKHLLIKDKESISEIAYRTGFSTPSYFSKCFKKEFGKTPSEMLLAIA